MERYTITFTIETKELDPSAIHAGAEAAIDDLLGHLEAVNNIEAANIEDGTSPSVEEKK